MLKVQQTEKEYIEESNNLRSKISHLEKEHAEEQEMSRHVMEEKMAAIEEMKGIVDVWNSLDKMKEENTLVWQSYVYNS